MISKKYGPIIRNVVSTANLNQKVNIVKLSGLSCGIYDRDIYGGRCGYVKTPEMEGRVTIFPSGKMISIGSKSIKKSANQLNNAKFYLVQENLIDDVELKPKTRNIVATFDFGGKVSLNKLTKKIPEGVYNPDIFPGFILKGKPSCSFLVFGTGKIVCAGGKSLNEVSVKGLDLIKKLKKLL